MPQFPEDVIDPDIVARNIYESWITLLKTDEAEGIEEVAKWSELDVTFREDFVESVKTNVTDPLRELATAFERSEDSFKKNLADVKRDAGHSSACYVCDREPVQRPGQLCFSCFESCRVSA